MSMFSVTREHVSFGWNRFRYVIIMASHRMS